MTNLPAVLDDLCSRFLINIPEEELENSIRICFAIEQAHWYYLDFCMEEDKDLPKMNMRMLMIKILNNYKPMKHMVRRVDDILTSWRNYKMTVPTYGAIMLNKKCSKVLLVRGWGKHGTWHFPRGKVNKEEAPLPCAIREVKEETGYNIAKLAHESNYIDCQVQKPGGGSQATRLYIVIGVPEDTKFSTQTRKEISDIAWHPLSELPRSEEENDPKMYWMVHPFVGRLRSWLKTKRGRRFSDGGEKNKDRQDLCGKRTNKEHRSYAAGGKRDRGEKKHKEQDVSNYVRFFHVITFFLLIVIFSGFICTDIATIKIPN
eukprot:m.99085 g.99085  ORF g.99085 m.99085 type:complete len:317 (-) comp13662_c0_seq2:1033-1983(-)